MKNDWPLPGATAGPPPPAPPTVTVTLSAPLAPPAVSAAVPSIAVVSAASLERDVMKEDKDLWPSLSTIVEELVQHLQQLSNR